MKTGFLIIILIGLSMACQSDRSKADRSNNPLYNSDKWVELLDEEGRIQLDLKYAAKNNLFKEKIYDCGKCFLTKAASDGLSGLIDSLNSDGYSIKVFDCYRPRRFQEKMDGIGQSQTMSTYHIVSDMHQRGLAVDFTLCDLSGKELDMGTAFDHQGPEAYHDFAGLSDIIKERRRYLLNITRAFGFQGTRTEWWHYTYRHSTSVMSVDEWHCD